MAEPQPPSGLRAWGQSLWDQVTETQKFDPAGYFVLAEACRTCDIIEKLSGALRSNNTEWLHLADEVAQAITMHSDGQHETLEISLMVNPILSEIRQQRLALRQLLAQLKLGNPEAGTGGKSALDELIANFNTPE
jgi:hypothetical protein